MFYIIRYGEIGTKGLNRSFFENILIRNIKECVKKKTQNFKIIKKQGRIIVESDENISSILVKIFGIVNFSIAEKADSYEELKNVIFRLLKEKNFSKFRVTATRLNKKFNKTSEEIAKEIGGFVVEKFGKKVDLKNFELNIQIEVLDSFFVFFDKIKSLGGLPVGVEGKVICLLENKEGFVTAFLVMKRGCDVICAGYEDFELSKLSEFCPHKIDFFKIKKFQDVEKLVKEKGVKAIVVQDKIGCIRDYKTKYFVMRPLIGMGKEEIDKILSLF
ncbi:MAG: THUMP domain-containing protein [Candidatus Woesearchaeota archaeon]